MDDQKQRNLMELEEYGYTARQLKTLTQTVAQGATLAELHLFLTVAKAAGLNPFLRQVYFVKRTTKHGPVVSIQTGIDGYRAIADKSGNYAGSDAPVFEFVSNADTRPISATSTVYRLVEVNGKKERIAITRTAYWDEYYPGDDVKEGFMWRKMPRTMLGKCAEALALRAAFPLNLSGMYIHEEMQQAGTGPKIAEAEVIDVNETGSSPAESEGASALNEAVKEVGGETTAEEDPAAETGGGTL